MAAATATRTGRSGTDASARVVPGTAGQVQTGATTSVPGATAGEAVRASSAGTANRASEAQAASPADPRSLDQLLSSVIDRLRAIPTPVGPGLESWLHHPDLGDIRLVVAGRTGETIHAELIAGDRRAAEALAHALDRSMTARGLVGIELRVRDGSADTTSGRDRSGSAWERGGSPDGTGTGTDGSASDRGSTSGDGAPARSAEPGASRRAADIRLPSIDPAITGRGRTLGRGDGPAVDIRA